MNDRPTKEIKTPIQGKSVILKEWITGREQEYIQEPIISAASIKAGVGGGQAAAELSGFKSSAITESSHHAIETVVVLVEGNETDVLKSVLDMHVQDYDFVMEAINEVIKKKG